MGASAGRGFDDITARLDEIIATVRSKDTSLERSLDLFDEAIELGSQAVELVDSLELSEREAELLDAQTADEPQGADEPKGASDPDAASPGAGAGSAAG